MSEHKKIESAVALLGPIRYGSIIKAETFEQALGLTRDDQAYSFLISRIRRYLCTLGFYLNGEGFSKTGCYEITAPEDNYWIAKLAVARAERDLESKMILLENTDCSSLTPNQQRRHEQMSRELSIKLEALRRTREWMGQTTKASQKTLPSQESS